MNNYLVYLSGPITGLNYAGSVDWRQEATRELYHYGINTISPMRAKEFLKNENIIKGSYEDSLFGSAQAITTRDRFDTQRSDVVLVNLLGAKTVSIGTMIEVGWADAARVPIVLVSEDDNIHRHPILDTCCGFKAKTLGDGLHIITKLLEKEDVF